MGVRGLTSYISGCSDAAQKLHLPRRPGTQQANAHSQSRRVVVVDGYGCLLKLYHGTWMHGGQLGEMREECRRFVEAWREAGFELVFIFDGGFEDTKRREWVTRRRKDQAKVRKVFEYLRGGKGPDFEAWSAPHPPYKQEKSLRVLPVAISHHLRGALKSLGVQVLNSIGEADGALATYCTRHSCWGVLGQDSDFVVLGVARYLSLETCKVTSKAIHVVAYSSAKVAQSLNLPPTALPIMAALVGNDFISHTALTRFHIWALGVTCDGGNDDGDGDGDGGGGGGSGTDDDDESKDDDGGSGSSSIDGSGGSGRRCRDSQPLPKPGAVLPAVAMFVRLCLSRGDDPVAAASEVQYRTPGPSRSKFECRVRAAIAAYDFKAGDITARQQLHNLCEHGFVPAAMLRRHEQASQPAKLLALILRRTNNLGVTLDGSRWCVAQGQGGRGDSWCAASDVLYSLRQRIYALILPAVSVCALRAGDAGATETAETWRDVIEEWHGGSDDPGQSIEVAPCSVTRDTLHRAGLLPLPRLWTRHPLSQRAVFLKILGCNADDGSVDGIHTDLSWVARANALPRTLLLGCATLRYLVTASDVVLQGCADNWSRSSKEAEARVQLVLTMGECIALVAQLVAPPRAQWRYQSRVGRRQKAIRARAVHVAALFMQAFSEAQLANAACGSPIAPHDAAAHHAFNGVMFHAKLQQVRELAPVASAQLAASPSNGAGDAVSGSSAGNHWGTWTDKVVLELCDNDREASVRFRRALAFVFGLSLQYLPPGPPLPPQVKPARSISGRLARGSRGSGCHGNDNAAHTQHCARDSGSDNSSSNAHAAWSATNRGQMRGRGRARGRGRGRWRARGQGRRQAQGQGQHKDHGGK